MLMFLEPIRQLYARFPRGSFARKALVPILKFAQRIPLTSLDKVAPADRPQIQFAPSDSMILPSIYWFGIYGYEGILCDYWQALCAQSNEVLEIGANIGFFSVLGGLANAKCRYTAVEPVPANAAILRENLQMNGIRHISVLEAAAVESSNLATVTLRIPREQRTVTVGAFVADAAEGVGDRVISEEIKVVARSMAELAAHADLIKIDAEGIEHTLLSSARDLLIARKPTLVIEVLPESRQLKAVISSLVKDGGYRIFAVPAYHLYAAQEISAEELQTGKLERLYSKDVILRASDLPPI